jgi:hypothetical protein
MIEHNIFYYPYASFTTEQDPLLKTAALYFDHLYLLDPEKATAGRVGVDVQTAANIALLEQEKILVRVTPEEVLVKFEAPLGEAIKADLNNPEFKKLCDESGRSARWTVALAKVPKDIRDDPQHRPLDTSMQHFMGDLPRSLAPDVARYTEVYQKSIGEYYQGPPSYDELRFDPLGKEIEFRYADYPLPLGESIMVNHALFAGLLYSNATPLTDDPFHSRVLGLKMQQANQIPAVRQAVEDRARSLQLAADQLAAIALQDPQLKLPALAPDIPLEAVLEYRHKHDAELEQVRDKLGGIAHRITVEPWSKEFAEELDHQTIPDISDKLDETRKARDAWLKSERGKRLLEASGIAIGAASVVLGLITAPLTPIALATAALTLTSGTAIPGTAWLLDWQAGKRAIQENGLHYLLMI